MLKPRNRSSMRSGKEGKVRLERFQEERFFSYPSLMGRNRKGNTTLCGRNLQRRRGTAQRDFFRDEVLAIGILVCWGKDMRARSENHLEVDEARLRREE